ncbi:hypothetical protein GY45DRAFT_1264139 [Cubamyces sp. BRFM 1775]|nr:hypothetical protein GY45DRAFT_1264139 [Cubamyces sp. BRFM 1775]
MSGPHRLSAPRQTSTPPILRLTGATRASTAKTVVTRQNKMRKLTSSQEAWIEAETVVPNLMEATAFLTSKSLIPEGSHAIMSELLISGLLHFAFSAPSHELARTGLIAFAYLAKEVNCRDMQEAVSDAVVERAKDQLRIRLDEHTSHVEDRIEELIEAVALMKKETVACSLELKEACETVQEAKHALMEARQEVKNAPQAGVMHGMPTSVVPPFTLDAAPMRVRRAATLTDLLQRQVLVRGVTLQTEAGNPLGELEVLDRARTALDEMGREGLSPPVDTVIKHAKVLVHGDAVFTVSSVKAVRWFLKPAVAKHFARKMGMTAQLIERTYKLVAEHVPVAFDPHSALTLRVVETAHKLRAGSITRADWIKPVDKRQPGQRTAFLMLTFNSVDQANLALKGLTLANRRVLVCKEVEEPKRCARCQRYDGHFARECKTACDVCANCAEAHPTCDCNIVGNPSRYRCAKCNEDGHASWDRACPTLHTKVRTGVH